MECLRGTDTAMCVCAMILAAAVGVAALAVIVISVGVMLIVVVAVVALYLIVQCHCSESVLEVGQPLGMLFLTMKHSTAHTSTLLSQYHNCMLCFEAETHFNSIHNLTNVHIHIQQSVVKCSAVPAVLLAMPSLPQREQDWCLHAHT
jgi:hypothetical protein